MTTYHRLLLSTTLGSALLTFCVLQAGGVNTSVTKHNQPQQLQSAPQPQATEYYVTVQPRLMTLAWQPCAENACQPQFVAHTKAASQQQSEVGI
ncbi:MAG: hypothetical protein WD177_08390 [Methylophaga sp.]